MLPSLRVSRREDAIAVGEGVLPEGGVGRTLHNVSVEQRRIQHSWRVVLVDECRSFAVERRVGWMLRVAETSAGERHLGYLYASNGVQRARAVRTAAAAKRGCAARSRGRAVLAGPANVTDSGAACGRRNSRPGLACEVRGCRRRGGGSGSRGERGPKESSTAVSTGGRAGRSKLDSRGTDRRRMMASAVRGGGWSDNLLLQKRVGSGKRARTGLLQVCMYVARPRADSEQRARERQGAGSGSA